MFKISKRSVIKATVVALVSMVVSVGIVLTVVPILGGHPDGPGFWMSAICPLVIAWPASAFQFHQHEKLQKARDQLCAMHRELDRMHVELTAAHSALQQKSRIDALTGALNRETFFDLLQEMSGETGSSALLIADADHFKRINDEFGHQNGDEALRGISNAIVSVLRPQDFWGRIGGEEFAIFLNGADREMAQMLAEMIRLATIATEIGVDGGIIPVSVSIGGACTRGGFDPRTLFNEADRRLYAAKRGGRNRVVMDDHTADGNRAMG